MTEACENLNAKVHDPTERAITDMVVQRLLNGGIGSVVDDGNLEELDGDTL